ncbi:MAG: HAMP domain-containing histidine kinase [Spirochaetales bacterium]|nr:HAMP domain-containing histidine kinase [Spirochaetales bacterium]
MLFFLKRRKEKISSHLRWKLTFSYMRVIILALVIMQCCLVAGIAYLIFNSPDPPPQAVGELVRSISSYVQPEFTEQDTDIANLEMKISNYLDGWSSYSQQQENLRFKFDIGGTYNTIVVLDTHRRIIASSDHEHYPGGSGLPETDSMIAAPLIINALAGELDVNLTGKLVALDDDTNSSYAAYPMQDSEGRIRWVVLAIMPLQRNDQWLGMAFIFILITIFVIISALFSAFIAGIFGFRSALKLTKPIKQLSAASRSIAEGDFSQPIEINTNDEIGQLARQFNVMSDKLKTAMSELNKEKKYAKDLLRNKQELAANVSHELRTPISSIRAHIESLSTNDKKKNREWKTYLNIIKNEIDIVNKMINDLFELSELETKEMELELNSIIINDVVLKTVRSFEKIAWTKHKIAINTVLAENLPAVYADTQRVSQILSNLIFNSLKFTTDGGAVLITTQLEDDKIKVEVKDTGIGIPQKDMSHIFERFYRSDNSRSRSSGGSGLGLAIVKQLVEMQGGLVGVESREGEGSSFWFTLMLVDNKK